MTRRKPLHVRQVSNLTHADYGATGPAAQARPSEIVTIEGKQRSSVRSDKIQVKRYVVECRVDFLNARGQLSDRQWRAGMRFRFHWVHGAKGTSVTGQYGAEGTIRANSVMEETEARINHRQLIDKMLLPLTDAERLAVVAICGQDETCAGRLRAVQSGLDSVADTLGIDKEFCR